MKAEFIKRTSEILVTVLLSASFLAAAVTGKISGRVSDMKTSEALIGVNVFLADTDLGAATDEDGYFMIVNIPPGTYTVRFIMIGYTGKVIEDVSVRSDHTTNLDTKLEQTMLEGKSVTVSANKRIIQLDRTSTESSVSGEQLKLMPVQTVTDVLNLQAGVVDGHFRGGRSNEVAYMIDGIPVNDAFNNSASLIVENDVIQELKVISGTFNAEYGQAQSAIVEMITREGSEDFSANASVTMGDYFSGNDHIYRHIDDISPFAYTDYSVTLRGPFYRRSNFILNYRFTEDEGNKYGRDYFERSTNDGDVWFSDSSGAIFDNYNYVFDPATANPDTSGFFPMDNYSRSSLFSKISFWLSDKDKLSLNFTWQYKDNGAYAHEFQYNPRGNSRIRETGLISYVTWNHMFNAFTYINMAISSTIKKYNRYLFKDKYDVRYSTDTRFRDTGNFAFYTGGTDMRYFRRDTDTKYMKLDYTSQVSRTLEVKAGAEIKIHSMHLDSLKLKKNAESGFEIEIAEPHTADNQSYDREPVESAVYIQTKLETKTITMNAGLRLDYFDSRGEVLDDLYRPQTSTRSPAESVTQVSPRFGLAYPISDRGVMHVSYGHFFQIPGFAYLYRNPDFVINPEEGSASVLNDPFGNANLKPQKTVAYEIGLQQQLSRDVSFEATAYYKDIRNLLGTETNTIAPLETFAGINYGRYINRDYGQVKGFTLMLEKAMRDGYSVSVDYTYMVAKGNSSDPKSVLIDQQADPPVESEKQLLPLDWDQKHSLNAQLTTEISTGWFVTVIGKLGTGMPYDLETSENSVHIANGGRKPSRLLFDLFSSRRFKAGRTSMNVTLKIYNLFDKMNELEVFQDSGRANYTEDLNQPGQAQGANSKAEYFNHPDWYSAPRQILLGLSIEL